METDAAWAKAAADASTIARDEFYGKTDFGVYGVYIEKALEKIIAIPTADPAKEFQAVQDLATKEALDKFKADNKGK